ncbi:hypothetical protein PTKIN_Ptkin17bG0007600 [Pterospermum kingtungense]
MELQHFSHQHPLLFIQQLQSIASEDETCCYGCGKLVDGPSSCCNQCKFYLHKSCAELELAPEITHPFHPQHLLTLLIKSPYSGRYECGFCCRGFEGFVYHCASCKFDLDINCAFIQSSLAENFPNYLHHHPLIFVQNHNEEVQHDCAGCKQPLSGPIYFCSDCCPFNLHKECGELPLQINHPYDRKHPLTLLPKSRIHPETCCCYLCKINWEGFFYCCSFCHFELTAEDVLALRTITAASHEHPWTLLSRQMSFICDFCGTDGDRTPYVCNSCDLLVHKNCISLPSKIMITRHHHRISHSHSLQQNQSENWECRICHKEVNTRYGSYYCSNSDCNYIAHVNCATDEEIWDGIIFLDDEDEESLLLNLITVIEETSIGEDRVARVIKHADHDHNLTLSSGGKIKDDNNCDACMGPLSTPFYSCDKCKFFLHKNCAELTRKKRHPFHKHLLTLENLEDDYSICLACARAHHGFRYKCLEAWYKYDKHPLILTYFDDSTPSQRYCDLCEKERHPNQWFYYCAECDNSLHINCAIGDVPFIKLGRKVRAYGHPHPLTFVKNIWNCPRCKICGELCNGQSLECKEPECNLIVHWECSTRLLKK